MSSRARRLARSASAARSWVSASSRCCCSCGSSSSRMTVSGVTWAPGRSTIRSTRPCVVDASQRRASSTGTSVPRPRTWRTIGPRFTVSRQTVLRLDGGRRRLEPRQGDRYEPEREHRGRRHPDAAHFLLPCHRCGSLDVHELESLLRRCGRPNGWRPLPGLSQTACHPRDRANTHETTRVPAGQFRPSRPGSSGKSASAERVAHSSAPGRRLGRASGSCSVTRESKPADQGLVQA